MNKNMLLIAAVAVIGIVGYSVLSQGQNDAAEVAVAPVGQDVDVQPTPQAAAPDQQADQGTQEDTAQPEETAQNDAAVAPQSAGQYAAYTGMDDLTQDTNVIFFAATWCPSCQALDKDINASLSEIPAGVNIFKADFDSQVELKKKYGVTSQHTMVQVDQNGELINKWAGGVILDDVLERVN